VKCIGFGFKSVNEETVIGNVVLSNHICVLIQSVPGVKVTIQGGHSIGHSKQKKVYMCMCPIPNGFRDRAISLYRRATRHVLTRAAKCIDVDGGIFENILHYANNTNYII
jgi:hypothetical protein